MPFKSEKQRKWMWANEPEIARRWEEEEKRLKNKDKKEDKKSNKKGK